MKKRMDIGAGIALIFCGISLLLLPIRLLWNFRESLGIIYYLYLFMSIFMIIMGFIMMISKRESDNKKTVLSLEELEK